MTGVPGNFYLQEEPMKKLRVTVKDCHGNNVTGVIHTPDGMNIEVGRACPVFTTDDIHWPSGIYVTGICQVIHSDNPYSIFGGGE